MTRLSVFSFGYYGWGNATERLVQAVDAAERERGVKPPVFVDIRIRRSVRAVGFREIAFGNLLGPSRYHWLKRLGNQSIVSRTGGIRIADPSAANDLLDLVVEAASDNRRVIFFCGCEFPKHESRVACHRVPVATLLRAAATRRGLSLETVEWPGGQPIDIDLDVDADRFKAVVRGGRSVPLGIPQRLGEWSSIPWASIASLHSGSDFIHRLVGPVAYKRGEWSLPILMGSCDPQGNLTKYRREARLERRALGLEPIRTP